MFIFDATNIINYEDYNSFIFSIKNRFDKEKELLFDIYNIANSAFWDNDISRYTTFRSQYRNLRQNVINEIIEKFRKFLPNNCLIYEFGSLAKFSDRIESDVDLTFCYDEKKTPIFECAEELINYSIAYVFEHSIDHVHGKFQHYPIIHDYDNLTEKDNLFILKFKHNCIEYKCGAGTLIENIMGKKNVRDYQSLIDGYLEKYILKCDIECLYSIIIIENSTKHDFVGDLTNLENNNNIFLNYSFHYQEYFFDNEIKISYIKKILKSTVVSIYIMISFLRRKIKWLNEYSMTIEDFFNSSEIEFFFGGDYIKNLRRAFIKTIFYWDKIELALKDYKISLSSRSHVILSKQDLDDILNKKYHENNLTDKILLSVNDLNILISQGWSFINGC